MNALNVESEQLIIEAVFLKPMCLSEVRAKLLREDFVDEKHRTIFETFCEMADHSIPIEPLALTNELERANILQKAGGKKYIGELAEAASTSASVPYHVEAVKEASLTRKLLHVAANIEKGLEAEDVNSVLSTLKDSIINLNAGLESKVIPIGKALSQTIDHLEQLSKVEGSSSGISTGFIDIDRYTGGWQNGELIIIAGRPGMGKSVLAKDFAETAGVAVGYFSLEMTIRELVKRHLAGKAGVNLEGLRTGQIKDEEWGKIIKAADSLAKLKVYLIDKGNLSIQDIIAMSENLKMTENIGLVIIDYLQLIIPKARLEIREREVAEISRQLKGMARNLNIPVICIAQLNRQCELRQDKRPRLSDLRESGAIEQDADIVVFLYRETLYDTLAPLNEAEFIIAKGRNIKTGTIPLFFDGECQIFQNVTRYEEGD